MIAENLNFILKKKFEDMGNHRVDSVFHENFLIVLKLKKPKKKYNSGDKKKRFN